MSVELEQTKSQALKEKGLLLRLNKGLKRPVFRDTVKNREILGRNF